MFNVHNGVSLAGYGYFPPLLYQALTNQVDPEKSPIDGSALTDGHKRALPRSLLGGLLILILTLILFI